VKITPEHYTAIKEAIKPLDVEANRRHYRKNGLSDQRYRWDLLRSTLIDGKGGIRWICDALYPYLNDDHIDTALRSIVPPLERA